MVDCVKHQVTYFQLVASKILDLRQYQPTVDCTRHNYGPQFHQAPRKVMGLKKHHATIILTVRDSTIDAH